MENPWGPAVSSVILGFDINGGKFQAALEDLMELDNLDREQDSKQGAARQAPGVSPGKGWG